MILLSCTMCMKGDWRYTTGVSCCACLLSPPPPLLLHLLSSDSPLCRPIHEWLTDTEHCQPIKNCSFHSSPHIAHQLIKRDLHTILDCHSDSLIVSPQHFICQSCWEGEQMQEKPAGELLELLCRDKIQTFTAEHHLVLTGNLPEAKELVKITTLSEQTNVWKCLKHNWGDSQLPTCRLAGHSAVTHLPRDYHSLPLPTNVYLM